jgi:intein/homing endonuclease
MKSKDSKNLKVVMEQGTELIEFYRNNPCIAAYDLLGVDFAPIQRVIFEDLWFRNYNITIMSRGCGKTLMLGVLAALSCLLYAGYRVGLIAPVFRQSTVISDTYDTFWTDGGLKTTAQEFYASVEEGVTKTQSLESQNTILSKWQNPERACRSIKTTRGFELAGTADHEILILDDELNLVFKELQEITEEDSIVIKKGFKYFGDDDSMPTFDEFKLNGRMNDCHIPKKLTPDLSYFFGLITGDGCVSFGKKIKGQNRINFTNNTKELTDSFSNIARKYFDAIPKFMDRTACGRSNQVDIYNTKLCYYLVKCGMSCTNAYDKCIPSVIKKASRKCIISFIRGCYDSDGCFCIQKDKRKKTHTMCACLHLSTVSYKLAKEVQAVLLNLGIFSSCETYKGKNGRIDHKVVINNLNEFIKFNNIIGFGCKYKQKLLDKYINKSVSKYSYSIPNSRKIVSNLAGSIESVMEVESDILIYIKQRYKYVTSYTMLKILELMSLAKKHNVLTEEYYKLKKIIDLGLSFVKMKESNYFFAPTIDVEVLLLVEWNDFPQF